MERKTDIRHKRKKTLCAHSSPRLDQKSISFVVKLGEEKNVWGRAPGGQPRPAPERQRGGETLPKKGKGSGLHVKTLDKTGREGIELQRTTGGHSLCEGSGDEKEKYCIYDWGHQKRRKTSQWLTFYIAPRGKKKNSRKKTFRRRKPVDGPGQPFALTCFKMGYGERDPSERAMTGEMKRVDSSMVTLCRRQMDSKARKQEDLKNSPGQAEQDRAPAKANVQCFGPERKKREGGKTEYQGEIRLPGKMGNLGKNGDHGKTRKYENSMAENKGYEDNGRKCRRGTDVGTTGQRTAKGRDGKVFDRPRIGDAGRKLKRAKPNPIVLN